MPVGDIAETVRKVVRALEGAGVPYIVTGSLASSYYGEPRLTRDVDIVVDIRADQLPRLVQELGESFVLDCLSAQDAISERDMFQAFDLTTTFKVDFHLSGMVPGEMERGGVVELLPNLQARLISKEDAILSKLRWIALGSGASRKDVIGMLLDPTPFDREFVRRMADSLGVTQILDEMEREAAKLISC